MFTDMIELVSSFLESRSIADEKILNVLENLPEENIVTFPEPSVPHIREILERMNKVLGQGPPKAAEQTA